MKAKVRRCFAVIMTAIVLFGGIPDTVFAKGLEGERQNMEGAPADSSRITEENAVTVVNNDDFLKALEQHKNPINVQGMITIANGADTDKRMLPVKIPAGTVVQEPKGSGIQYRAE